MRFILHVVAALFLFLPNSFSFAATYDFGFFPSPANPQKKILRFSDDGGVNWKDVPVTNKVGGAYALENRINDNSIFMNELRTYLGTQDIQGLINANRDPSGKPFDYLSKGTVQQFVSQAPVPHAHVPPTPIFTFAFSRSPISKRNVLRFSKDGGNTWNDVAVTQAVGGANALENRIHHNTPFMNELRTYLGTQDIQGLINANRDPSGKPFDYLSQGTVQQFVAQAPIPPAHVPPAHVPPTPIFTFAYSRSPISKRNVLRFSKDGGNTWNDVAVTQAVGGANALENRIHQNTPFMNELRTYLGTQDIQGLINSNKDPSGKPFDYLSKGTVDNFLRQNPPNVQQACVGALGAIRNLNRLGQNGLSAPAACANPPAPGQPPGALPANAVLPANAFGFYEAGSPSFLLTNLARAPFNFQGVRYKSSEHFFQANKWPRNSPCFIAVVTTPAGGKGPFLEAKKCEKNGPLVDPKNPQGPRQGVAQPINPNWANDKRDLMCTALIEKFKNDAPSHAELCSHSNEVLIETAGDNDAYWGHGIYNRDPLTQQNDYIPGQPGVRGANGVVGDSKNNQLGESLMWVAKELCPNYIMPKTYRGVPLPEPYCARWDRNGRLPGFHP